MRAEFAEIRVDDNELGCPVCTMRKPEGVDELELIVEVVLEPEHDLVAANQGVEELRVSTFELAEHGTIVRGYGFGEKRGAYLQQLVAGHLGHRPLVKGVFPREHGSADRRLPKRVDDAVSVRDVE